MKSWELAVDAWVIEESGGLPYYPPTCAVCGKEGWDNIRPSEEFALCDECFLRMEASLPETAYLP